MNGGQVAVSICKSRVDLNGTCVALQCPLHILHFFQGVPHVGISISKGWTNPVVQRGSIIILGQQRD